MPLYTEGALKKYADQLFVIHPMLPQSITGTGYDLHIGYFLKIRGAQVVEKGTVDPILAGVQALELEPHSSLLCITFEHVYLSCRLAGTMHVRASYANQGIYMNSTTVDPDWSGQQIYLLVNIGSAPVTINLREHFCTLTMYDVKSKSYAKPRDQRNILVKYLALYKGDTEGAFEYLMASNDSKREFEAKVERVKRLNAHRNMYVALYFLTRSGRRHIRLILINLVLVLLFATFLVVFFNSAVFASKEYQAILQAAGGIGTLITIVIALLELNSRTKRNEE